MSTSVPLVNLLDDSGWVDAGSVTRTETVWPGMCGPNALLVGHIGDWTWDAVSRRCGTDVLRARNAAGAPTYLSFYYYRVRGSARFHLRTPSFGDRLLVTTRLFDFGSESVLALHRISRSPAGELDLYGGPLGAFTADEFYRFDDDDCLYVENYNRWISRPDERSNRDLVRSSPTDFRHRHLPKLPPAYSPRLACHRARTRLTFRDEDTNRYVAAGPRVEADYTVDITRDLNGVGMLYFATYFSIVDWALLRWWRSAGRSERSFLDRVVVDQQLCFLGNADAGGVITASVRPWRVPADDTSEAVDVVLRDGTGDRVLAVCTLWLLRPASMPAPERPAATGAGA